MVKRITANLVAGTAVFSGLGLILLLAGCGQRGNTALKDNTPTRLPDTSVNNPHLAYFKQSMAALGETAAIDTHFSRYLYLGYWYLQRAALINIRDLAQDTLSLISFTKYTADRLRYVTDSGLKWPDYIYPYDLHKAGQVIPKASSLRVFRYLDTLITRKEIRPFGVPEPNKHDGDIVDGGYWLVYYDGRKYYESQSSALEELWILVGKNADLSAMVAKMNEPVY